MTRQFRLAALMRVRTLEQDRAAARVTAARSRLDQHDQHRQGLSDQLAGSPHTVADAAALTAAAAARAAAGSMLTALASTTDRYRGELDQAHASFQRLRTEVVGLEKLADRHATRVLAEDHRGEQSVLDEAAVRTWYAQQGAHRWVQ